MNAEYLQQCIDHERAYIDTVIGAMRDLNPVERYDAYCAGVRARNKTKPAHYRNSIESFEDFKSRIMGALSADRVLAHRRLRKLTLQLEKLEIPL